MVSIYSSKSPSGVYVIYDQFHFGCDDHFVMSVKGKCYGLKLYSFYKSIMPDLSLGFCTIEYFNHLKMSYKCD